MTVKEWMEKTYTGIDYNVRPYAWCVDGFGVSIQGGTPYHYCEPRANINMYHSLELGFPSEEDVILSGKGETDDQVGTVFPYVPLNIVEKLISKHGGIDFDKSIKTHNEKYKDMPSCLFKEAKDE